MTELAQISLLLKAAKPVEEPHAVDADGAFQAILAALTPGLAAPKQPSPLPKEHAQKTAEPAGTEKETAPAVKLPVPAAPKLAGIDPRPALEAGPVAEKENDKPEEVTVAPVRAPRALAKAPAQDIARALELVRRDDAGQRPAAVEAAKPQDIAKRAEASSPPASKLAPSALAEIAAAAKSAPEQLAEIPKAAEAPKPARADAKPAPKPAPKSAPKSAASGRVVVIDRTPKPDVAPAVAPKAVEAKPVVPGETAGRAPRISKPDEAPEPDAEAAPQSAASRPGHPQRSAERPAPQAPQSRPQTVSAPEETAPAGSAPAIQIATNAVRPAAHGGTAPAPQPAAKPDIPALASAIAQKSRSGARLFEIRLDPPELGRVEVHLSVAHDGKAEATLYADRPDTLALLQRDSQNLERALKDAGLDVSNSSLNFSLKGEERQGDGGGASRAHVRNLSDAVVARSEAVNASLAPRSSAPSSARLDIFV